MVKKLRLKESVNTMPDNVYDSIALLGYTCALAANDFHHIHLCAEGDKFQEIHESADKYLADVRELGDICLELAKEGNIELMNETYALDILKDNGGSDWQVSDKASYGFEEAFTEMSNILSDLTQGITLIEAMDGVTSDVISVMDEWARKFSKEVNYFIAKKLGKNEEVLMSQNESLRNRRFKESVSNKDIETVIKAALDIYTKDDFDAVAGSLLTINKKLFLKYRGKELSGEYSYPALGKEIADDLYYMINESMKRNRKGSLKESYKDSEAYKKLAEYDYILDANGDNITIKWPDGDVYAKFHLVPPTEEDLADGLDEWLVYADGQLANNSFDYYPATYDQAVKCAIEYFWSHY